MAKRKPISRIGVTWTSAIAAKHSADALRYAIIKTGATQADAAKWCKVGGKSVSQRTIVAWLAGTAPLNVRAVLCSGRLRGEFLRYLQTCHRKSVPLAARAKRGSR